MEFVGYIVTALAAYLLGSIPTGFLVGRAKGIDIRTVGSGNIGATNVLRALGKVPGVFVMLADAAKGYLASQWLAVLMRRWFEAPGLEPAYHLEVLSIIAAFAAILGHNYTCWLGFKGGKGVATTGGVLLGLLPGASALGFGVWLIALALTRYVSVASIAAAISLPFGVWIFKGDKTLVVVAALMGALGIYKHKANLRRLLNGTEPRFGRKKNSEETK